MIQVVKMVHSDGSKSCWLQFGNGSTGEGSFRITAKLANQLIKKLCVGKPITTKFDGITSTAYLLNNMPS